MDIFASLDPLDRALIAELRANSRAPISQLAQKLGVTRATVNARLERLVADEVILGFTVRLAAIGEADSIHALCHLSLEGRNIDAATRALRGMPEIVALHATNGEWDVIAEIRAASLIEVDDVLNKIRRLEGIHRSETNLLLRSERW